MSLLMNKETSLRLHERAVSVARKYKTEETELLDIFQELDRTRAFLDLGYSSLYQYALKALELSEGTVSNLIVVARKSKALPELKAAVARGEMTLSNARRIAPVLNLENKSEWIEKAKGLPQKKLEQELARAYPKETAREQIKYTSRDRVDLQINISSAVIELARRVQNLLSQKTSRAVKLEEALETVLKEYVERHDPLEKAKRAKNRELVGGVRSAVAANRANHLARARLNTREPIAAALKHKTILRDGAQCSFINDRGEQCESRRWLEIHHVKPVSHGGTNELTNLKTLCAAHHKAMHQH